MKNVADIKKEKNLNFVLPKQSYLSPIVGIDHYEVIVVIHLHYLDTVEFYMRYVKNIPETMSVVFSASDDSVMREIEKHVIRFRKNYKIIKKENRGRDISSFLVACRKEILNYNYVCFLHDKKAKTEKVKEDVQEWVTGLWENSIGGKPFVYNVLKVFADNHNIGLLAPIIPITANYRMFYENTWYENFESTKKLAAKLDIKCDLDYEKAPITLGTVFWARVSALDRLLNRDWQYEDFDAEPLANDGTLSHSIERILAYAAQDAGYDTGWLMTDHYAGVQAEYSLEILNKAFNVLNDSLRISNITELEHVLRLKEFVKRFSKVYIYGAGVYGNLCYDILKNANSNLSAFIVSNMHEKNQNSALNMPVCVLSDITLDESCGVIIAVSSKYYDEVLCEMKKRYPHFSNLFFFKRQ